MTFDEMTNPDGSYRDAYLKLGEWLKEVPPEMVDRRRTQAEVLFRRMGITFAVYGDESSTERLIPFDLIPRILTKTEWTKLEKGLIQRVTALNMFLSDIYGKQEILKAGLIPEDLVFQNAGLCPEMLGQRVPHNIYVHIGGIDIVRVDEGTFYVLEDNARTPSGVSYMMQNRDVMMRLFPELFTRYRVAPVEPYCDDLLATLTSISPKRSTGDPTIVLLTPGQYNSAYFEHSFLADRMGIELVEGCDLYVHDNVVYMRTTEGPKRVDVIYRRIDDEYLDPLVFRPESTLGVPGLMGAYLAGNVTISNAVGTGISDDKALYTYMPEIIQFYLGQSPLLSNVPTWRCREADSYTYVKERLHELVVKRVDGSGGYGMLVGPTASKKEREDFAKVLAKEPDKYIAQPTLALSTCPTMVEKGVAPRHVDLRPFVLSGSDRIRIVPGGLTRVALKEGSLVVNSSQGGGTKDTWVVDE
jgi:uncharacterized circularly permuted ATP-grasp superfamily protein